MTCTICFDGFTSSLRKQTDCSYCNASVCRSCIQQYLLMDTSLEPNCPSCRAGWSRDFLNETMTAAFRNGPFKAHRAKVLVDRERARLPETQEQAEVYKHAKEQSDALDKEIRRLNAEMTTATVVERAAYVLAEKAYIDAYKEALQEYSEAVRGANPNNVTYARFRRNFDYAPTTVALSVARKAAESALKAKRRSYMRQMLPLYQQRTGHSYVLWSHGILPARPAAGAAAAAAAGAAAAAVDVVAPARAVFTQKCPATNCEGFLSTQWKCGLCDGKFCKDCHETKDDEHVCDPDMVASVKAIKKEAKPCPKCASQISKIDGCDQMWCTQCHTAFSWNTGKVETHVVHNPHYFQWMRENGVLPRAPGDAPNPMAACGGIDVLLRRMAAAPNPIWSDNEAPPEKDAPPASAQGNILTRRLQRYVQLFQHILHYEIPRLRRNMLPATLEDDRRKLRVKRMVQEITEDGWRTALQKLEKDELKTRARLQLYEMYAMAGMDILGQFHTDGYDMLKIARELKNLYDFTDKANAKTAKAFSCVPLKIEPRPLN